MYTDELNTILKVSPERIFSFLTNFILFLTSFYENLTVGGI